MSILPGWQAGLIFAGEEAPPELTFLQATDDIGNKTTYTYTGVNFGAADANRRLYFVVAGQSNTTTGRTISSATIGGVTAVVDVEITDGGAGNDVQIAIIAADVPTGTSGTVSITYSGGCLANTIVGYRAVNVGSVTPHATATDFADDPMDVDVNVQEDGFIIGGAYVSTTGAWTTTGLTEDHDAAVESARQVVAGSTSLAAAATPHNIQFSRGATTQAIVGVAASYR